MVMMLTEGAEAEKELPPEVVVVLFPWCDLGVLVLVHKDGEVMTGTTRDLHQLESGLRSRLSPSEEVDCLGVKLA